MTDLLLLHGALGSSQQFAPWLPVLAPGFNVRSLDFEGHGARAFADRPFAIDHFVENVVHALDEAGISKIDIFGYSMGGYVALRMCRLHPERVGKVFTFASKLAWNPESAAKESKMLDPDTILAKVPKFAEMLAARHHGNDWQGHLARTADMMRALGQAPVLTQEDFAAIQHPVRMGIGDRDNMVGLEETIAAYRSLPNGELFVMPGTGHPVEKMDVGRICGEIRGWFGG